LVEVSYRESWVVIPTREAGRHSLRLQKRPADQGELISKPSRTGNIWENERVPGDKKITEMRANEQQDKPAGA